MGFPPDDLGRVFGEGQACNVRLRSLEHQGSEHDTIEASTLFEASIQLPTGACTALFHGPVQISFDTSTLVVPEQYRGHLCLQKHSLSQEKANECKLATKELPSETSFSCSSNHVLSQANFA